MKALEYFIYFEKTFCIIVCSLYISASFADENDLVNLLVGVNSVYDSNLFRVPSGTSPSTANGSSKLWDNINSTNLGINIAKQYGLQQFRADYQITSNKYQNNKYLDFDAKQYDLGWNWSLSPDLTGDISKNQTQSLVSFENFRGGTQIVLTVDQTNFDFDYSPHQKWHLIGGYTDASYKNSQTFTQQASNTTKTFNGGLKYQFESASFVSFIVRNVNGQFLGQNLDFINQIDDGFRSQVEELNGKWILSGKSTITFQAANKNYKSNNFIVRDFSGNYGNITYEWDFLPKVSLNLNLQRTIDPYVTNISSYSVIDSLSVIPTWNISSKLALKPTLNFSERSYLGGGPLTSTTERVDKIISYGMDLTWMPIRSLSTVFSVLHQARNSNFNGFGFIDNTVSFSANWDF